MSGRPGLVVALVAASLGCAGNTARSATPATPVARCEIGDTALVRDVLYFGRNRPDGGTVSDTEWQTFLNDVVTPRFPAGLTVMEAAGQWRGANGAVERERSAVLTVMHGGDDTARRLVGEVAGEYKQRFRQEAVLRERGTVCVRF